MIRSLLILPETPRERPGDLTDDWKYDVENEARRLSVALIER